MSAGRRNRILFWGCAALLTSLPGSAWACSACFGKSDSALAKGMNAGIFTLLGIVAVVLTGCAAFLVHLVRRSAMAAEAAAPPPVSTEAIPNEEIVAIHE